MNDKLKRIEELLAEMQKCSDEMKALADELRATPEENTVDVLSIYINDITSGVYKYWVNSDGEVQYGVVDCGIYEFNPYCNYNDDIYAEKAARMKKFADMLLAFKWCYDRKYEPDWSAENPKYCVLYDTSTGRYDTDCCGNWLFPFIYFSSMNIAQKCVDWLNSIDPKGTLLLGTDSNGKEASV